MTTIVTINLMPEVRVYAFESAEEANQFVAETASNDINFEIECENQGINPEDENWLSDFDTTALFNPIEIHEVEIDNEAARKLELIEQFMRGAKLHKEGYDAAENGDEEEDYAPLMEEGDRLVFSAFNQMDEETKAMFSYLSELIANGDY